MNKKQMNNTYTTSALPVIFLAFANDRRDYLYNLTEEQNGIRNALRSAERNGLCEVVYETDTDIDKIFRTFDEYQDRIAIFHYGGHAEDYSLLLKAASGERQYARSEGLMAFLAQQKGLQLAFINGCCSRQQAEALRDAGVPAVIGTAQPIDDQAATLLSIQFYESLAAGRTLDQAWQAAEAKVKTRTGAESGYRVRGGIRRKDEPRVSFPWNLYIRPGAETVQEWNLPRAAHNPLHSLPLPDSYYRQLPPAPFVGLHYFRKEDAGIFFGRGAQVRELYNHICGIFPIILLYGQSGVGKSSLLDAGLLPRIEDKFSVVYARRSQEMGLSGTLDAALQELAGEPGEETKPESEAAPENNRQEQRKAALKLLEETSGKIEENQVRQALQNLIDELHQKAEAAAAPRQELSGVLRQWRRVEEQTGRPLIVILDQVEEKFTRPMPAAPEDELTHFLRTIQPLFAGEDSGIRGKLILSYRKEYHPEIRDTFQALSLPYSEVFLKRLDREGIIEAVRGVNLHEATRWRYRLELEDSEQGNLPEIIADDLLEDRESPVAPVLQIVLKKLWEITPQPPGEPRLFTVGAYQELKQQGVSMSEFFHQQMAQLAENFPLEVDSGLALALLQAHTTRMGSAGSCRREDLLDRYDAPSQRLKALLQQLIDLSLLARIDNPASGAADPEAEFTTILAHDTLAPVVIREFNLSDRPGQKAMRVLANRSGGWRDGKEGDVLDETDMAVIKAGTAGMRKLNSDEQRLWEASRQALLRQKKQARRKLWAAASIPGILALLGGLVYLVIQFNTIYENFAPRIYTSQREEIRFTRSAPFEGAVTTGYFVEDLRDENLALSIKENLEIGFGQRNDWKVLAGQLPKLEKGKLLYQTGHTAAGLDTLLALGSDAFMVLAELGVEDERVVALMLKSLADPRSMDLQQTHAALTTMARSVPGVITALGAALQSGDESWQPYALELLLDIGATNPQAAEILRELLKTGDPELRIRALEGLRRINPGDASTRTAFLQFLKDPDPEVRRLALQGLIESGLDDIPTLEALAGRLGDADSSIRWEAARALAGSRQHAGAVEKCLVDFLRDDHPDGKQPEAAELLGKIPSGGAPGVSALERALDNNNTHIQFEAARSLANLGQRNERIRDILLHQLSDRQGGARREAALQSLLKSSLIDSLGTVALLNLLQDRGASRDLQLLAARALGEVEVDMPRLLKELQLVSDPAVLDMALMTLARKKPETVTVLVEMVPDTAVPRDFRQAAAGTLGEIAGSNENIAVVLRRAVQRDMLDEAAVALGRMGRIENIIDELATYAGHENAAYREAAVNALAAYAPEDPLSITVLLTARKDARRNVRSRAETALSALASRHEQVAAALRADLSAGNEMTQFAAAGILASGGLADDSVVAVLSRRMNGEFNPASLGETAQLLLKAGQQNSRAVAVLGDALTNNHPNVRNAAAMALGRLEKPSRTILTGLLETLKDPDESVRSTSIASLRKVGLQDPRLIDALSAMTIDSVETIGEEALNALTVLLKPKAERDLLAMLAHPLSGHRAAAVHTLALRDSLDPETVQKIEWMKSGEERPWARLAAWEAGMLIRERHYKLSTAARLHQRADSLFQVADYAVAGQFYARAAGTLTGREYRYTTRSDSLQAGLASFQEARCAARLEQGNRAIIPGLQQALRLNPPLGDTLRAETGRPGHDWGKLPDAPAFREMVGK